MRQEDQNKTSDPKVKKKRFGQGMPLQHLYAAGIDVGDTLHDVAISDGAGGHEVREYGSFTGDLINLVGWLKTEGITTVAM
jgi:hypothetical protein